jgi:hypothetical protein
VLDVKIGARFSFLKIIKRENRKWIAVCDCGTITKTTTQQIERGSSRSCGCMRSALLSKASKTHGETVGGKRTPEYAAWVGMVYRCETKTSQSYKDYGGRGVKVCKRWLSSYESFLSDVGRRPSRFHSLGRVDNDKGYFPKNVKWATRKEQERNKRSSRRVTINGVTKCLVEWVNDLKLTRALVESRIYLMGWSPKKALLTPRIRRRRCDFGIPRHSSSPSS